MFCSVVTVAPKINSSGLRNFEHITYVLHLNTSEWFASRPKIIVLSTLICRSITIKHTNNMPSAHKQLRTKNIQLLQ